MRRTFDSPNKTKGGEHVTNDTDDMNMDDMNMDDMNTDDMNAADSSTQPVSVKVAFGCVYPDNIFQTVEETRVHYSLTNDLNRDIDYPKFAPPEKIAKVNKKADKETNSLKRAINHQTKNLEQMNDKIDWFANITDSHVNTRLEKGQDLDYKMMHKMHTDRKALVSKTHRVKEAINKTTTELEHQSAVKNRKEKKRVEKITLNNTSWYSDYNWFYTKNNFLVVGGRNSNQSEVLVKRYMRDTDYYFHTSEEGSGSYVLFVNPLVTENPPKTPVPEPADIQDAVDAIMCFSKGAKNGLMSATIYWTHGNQVSKTAQTGEFVGKGSFIVRGTRNMIQPANPELGYIMYGNDLMLAPYSVCIRQASTNERIKLSIGAQGKGTRQKQMRQKVMEKFNLANLPDSVYLPTHMKVIG